ncbi:MAG: DUF4430 domain-containing protein [Lachnospiraceae bacterium]|nr:DUF4430 domain-containing protein [Lachnospiraceae bacterium]
MKKKILFNFILCFVLAFLCIGKLYSAKAGYDASNEAKSIIDGIISFNAGNPGEAGNTDSPDSQTGTSIKSQDAQVLEFIRTSLVYNIGGTAEWYVLGLSQYGDYDFTEYREALEKYVSEKKITGASAKLKFALLLSYVDGDKSYIDKTLTDDSIGGQGIMSYVFGLHLLNNGFTGTVSADEIIDIIGSFQHEDGGWSVMGDYGDVDVTAMVLQAIAPYTDKAFVPDPGNTNSGLTERQAVIITMAKRGIEFLSGKQEDDGVFASFGVRNAESTAQVITALSALGIDCAADDRFIKNGISPIDGIKLFLLEDGCFAHKEGDVSSPSATVQTFYSMVAYLRCKEGMTPLYVRDKNEKKLNVIFIEKADPAGENDKDENISNSDNTENNADSSESRGTGYKPKAIAVLIGVCLVVCGILFALKKHWKNYLFVGLVAVAGVLVIIFTDFSKPEDYYGQSTEKENAVGTVTMSIRCDILKGKEPNAHIPKDYCILDTTEFKLLEGESVYDILLEAAKEYSISVEHEGGSDIIYISGINYLYENDYGDLSGWVYKVNGVLPSVGCGGYKPEDGDVIEWCYTLDLGNDVTD